MGIDRIGGMGAMNTMPTSTPRTQTLDIQPVNAVEPQAKMGNTSSYAKEGGEGFSKSEERDKAGVMSDKEISPDKVKAAVDDLNKQVRHTQCSFKYHDDTNRISITVMDSETQEVIKEIPPEKALDMIAKAWELAGLMVDEKR